MDITLNSHLRSKNVIPHRTANFTAVLTLYLVFLGTLSGPSEKQCQGKYQYVCPVQLKLYKITDYVNYICAVIPTALVPQT